MQARDPKGDRPAGTNRSSGPPGRPPFGVGPIARVGPSGPARERAPEAAANPRPPAAGPTATVRTPMLPRPGEAIRPVMPSRSGMPTMPPARGGFGLPNLRRNVCPHFYMTGTRGAIPIQAPHLLKGLIRQDSNVSRCQLRGGVHMEQGYVNDVCLTPRFNQCVFYEDDLSRE
jgi:hypothetical protein